MEVARESKKYQNIMDHCFNYVNQFICLNCASNATVKKAKNDCMKEAKNIEDFAFCSLNIIDTKEHVGPYNSIMRSVMKNKNVSYNCIYC